MQIEDFNKTVYIIENILTEQLKNINVIPTEFAPSTYKELKESFDGINLKVFNGNNDKAIFSPQGNINFRAWHDLGHLKYGLSFKFKDEIRLGYLQADDMYRLVLRYSNDVHISDCAYKIIVAEIVGQIEYYMLHNNYVENQKEYVMNYLGVKSWVITK